MTLVHLRRVSLFLPPFIVGVQDQSYTPFIHSTILPNDLGLTWAFPQVANRHQLLPTLVMAAALNVGLLATAPISEGRYGLFILICGQVTLVYWWLESRAGAARA